mmetsp:Transcript_29434/g.51679  ORF Transcript_29434/g.51679 Transcript_29434/m.51679 type:complete len:372 (-) Transcript_29434:300-1415(-)
MKVISIYRQLIRLGKRYPSSNRKAILEEIRMDFKKNSGLTESDVIQKEIHKASIGLAQIQMMVQSKSSGISAAIQLGQWDTVQQAQTEQNDHHHLEQPQQQQQRQRQQQQQMQVHTQNYYARATPQTAQVQQAQFHQQQQGGYNSNAAVPSVAVATPVNPNGTNPGSLENPPPAMKGNFYLVEMTVQCAKCGKWRGFVTSEVSSAVDKKNKLWVCDQCPHPSFEKCTAPEKVKTGVEIKSPNGPWNYSRIGMSSFDRVHYETYFALPDWSLPETLELLNFAVKNGAESWDKIKEVKGITHSPEECRARFWHILTLGKLFVQGYIDVAKQKVSTIQGAKTLAQYEAKIDLGIKAKEQLHAQKQYRQALLQQR